MRYFIGCLIEKEPAWYYDAITADLARNFDITNLSETTPPHITIKPPFETEDLSAIETTLEQLADSIGKMHMRINGFGKFDETGKTIFLSVEMDPDDLQKIEIMIGSLEPLGNGKTLPRPFHPHIAVARHLEPAQSKNAWNYLQNLPAPRFETNFSNLTLFRFDKPEWMIEKTLEFNL